MTIEEAGRQYGIPLNILREYETWGLCDTPKKVTGAWQYDDSDLEKLSLIMTLHDSGFDISEIENYMKLLANGEKSSEECLCILDRKRKSVLDKIHVEERRLEYLDYLRYRIRSERKV